MQPYRRNVLRGLLAFSILSTASHYSHNFVEMDSYPGGGPVIQVLIVLSWPILTAIGLYGYRLYVQGRYRDAHIHLLIYSFTGLDHAAALRVRLARHPAVLVRDDLHRLPRRQRDRRLRGLVG